jgi:protein TonB
MRLHGWLALSVVMHVGLSQFRVAGQNSRDAIVKRPMTIEILEEPRAEIAASTVSSVRDSNASTRPSALMSPKVSGRAPTQPVGRTDVGAPSAAEEALVPAFANTAEPSVPDDLATSSPPNEPPSPQASTTRVTLPHTVDWRARDRYFGALRATVERHREYPLGARRMRLEGTALVRISIARNGHLVAVHVRQSSGEGVLDNAAMNAVRSVASFPTAPADVEGETFTLDLPFVFRLRN